MRILGFIVKIWLVKITTKTNGNKNASIFNPVKEEFDFIEELNLLANELKAFRSNDLLVNLNEDDVFPWQGEQQTLNSDLQKLMKEAHKFEQNQGIHPLCLSEGVLKTTYKDKEIVCPVFLYYVTPTTSVVKDEVRWTVAEETCFVNPFLTTMFEKEVLPTDEDPKSFWTAWLQQEGLHFEPDVKYLGNFHPFRYALLKDISGLLENEKGKKLSFLFSDEMGSPTKTKIPSGYLFGIDGSQNQALNAAYQGHTVVQGPPGTGKSQVIGNLVGKALFDQKKVLVCAQKKQALEVIFAKLKSIGLDDFCILKPVEASSKSVVKSIEHTWKKLEEKTNPQYKESNFEFDLQKTQNLLTTYHQEGLIGKLSPKAFLEISAINLKDKHTFVSGLPSFDLWHESQKALASLPESLLVSLSFLQFNGNLSLAYEDILARTEKSIKRLEDLKLTDSSFSGLRTKFMHAQLVHTYGSEHAQKCLAWIPKSSKIEKLQRKKAKIALEIEAFNADSTAWKKIPSFSELTFLTGAFQQTGFLSSFKKVKLRKTWLRTPEVDLVPLMKKTVIYHDLLKMQHSVNQEFLTLGFLDTATELPLFNAFKAMYDSENFKIFHAFSTQEIQFYRTHFSDLNTLFHELKTHYFWEENHNPHALLRSFLANFNDGIKHLKTWDSLPPVLRQSFRHHQEKDKLAQAIVSSTWSQFVIAHPSFEGFAREGMLLRTRELGGTFHQASLSFAEAIELKRKQKFEAYHDLMGKPNHKLTPEEKDFKRILVQGKRILVKVFNRQRNFPSIRMLMMGDARHWIQVLKPVWLSSPLQLAEDFPLEPQLFDYGIFDEASQIPLSNALGAMFRSEKILVSGDSQQMPPIQFFQTGALEQVSLLDHSAYYLANFQLRFHYRAEQPELIAFSNRYFYNDSLIAFPSYPKKPSLFWHYIKDGMFENGENDVENEAVAKLVRQALTVGESKIGVVTFSEKQLQALMKKFSWEERVVLAERMEKGLMFMKTLEQVQGDECDEIIVAFGYGKNALGKFEMRFGPLNLESGRKRLNVLFSRARKKIHFVSSVCREDFPVSSNESIRLLTKWFEFLSDPKDQIDFHFPLEAVYQHQNDQLIFKNLADISPSVFDLVSIVSVLEQRGWEIKESASF